MSTVGEAAALFGSEDSADPFNSLGPEVENTPAQDLFSTQSATDLFGASAGDDASFLTQADPPSQPAHDYTRPNDSWSGHTAQYSSYEPQSTSHVPPPTPGSVAQKAPNGWGGQQTQWSGYEPQQYNPPANGAYTSQSQTASSQYAAYTPSAAPATTSTYSAHGTSYVPNAYDPPATSTSQSAYDPYKPTQPSIPPTTYNAPASVPAYPQFVDASSSIPNVSVASPPPPARSATSNAVYRPKTSNAYDPPIPPPKQAPKRTSVWPAPASPAPYTLPTSPPRPQAAPLPPPPRTPSLPPPPARPPSLPPPPPRSSSIVREYTPPPPRAPYTSATSPPPPRVPSRSAVSPPHHGLNGTLPSPPSRGPTVTQYSPPQHTPVHSPDSPPAIQHDAHASPQYVPFAAPSMPADSAPLPSRSPENTYGHVRGISQEQDSTNAYAPVGQESHVPVATSFETIEAPVDSHTSNDDELHSDHAVEPEAETSPTYDADPEAHAFYEDIPEDGPHQSLSSETVVPSVSQPQTTSLFSLPEEDPEGNAAEDPFAPVNSEAEHVASEAKTSSSGDIAALASPPTAVKEPATPAYDPYNPARTVHQQALSRSGTPDRAKSPGNASIRSYTSGKYSIDNGPPPATRPPLRQASKDPYAPASYNAYDPPMVAASQRSASPSSFSVRSAGSLHARETVVRDPYAPGTSTQSNLRDRSMSTSSMLSTGTSASEDPYAPFRHRQQPVGSSPYGSYTAPSALAENGPPSGLASSHSQVLTVPPTRAPYAPSPSLLGTNDPLGRTSVRIPIVSFGSGGKLVTCFHGSSSLSTGFDVAMSSRASSIVHMRPLHTAIPQSALDTSAATYPGPLFSDPGTPVTTLVRTGAATQAKNKKARVIKYLEERAEETSSGIGYLHRGSVESHRAQAKLAMIKLLKVMVENDGRLSGSAEIDSAVRSALIPDLPTGADASADALHVPAAASYASLGAALQDPNDMVMSTHTLRSSQLDKIQKFLIRGDRRAAFQYAADEKLWAHAMVIASSVDKEAWKEVVTEFLRAELSPHDVGSGSSDSRTAVKGRESLKVAYSLFAGGGPAAVQELAPVKPLAAQLQTLPLPIPAPVANVTPVSASFMPPVQMAPLPAEVLAKWAETAAMILNSTMTTESYSALTALGDQLAANNWHEAAHVCYLLSPQTSLWGGVGMPAARLVLYGASTPNFWKDSDPVIFSEIVEFALSLAPPAKGQEAFPGIPHLQAYKLIRAESLAELGHIELANRYCEAISSSLSRGSPYLNATFGEQLQGLVDRLTAAPVLDKSGSWIGSKMTRPSLDKLGGWLENRFASFIAGEGDSPKPEEHDAKKNQTFSGPFAHYSTISSTTTSTMPSPQMSSSNLTEVPAAPPFRTGSAMALRPPPSAAPAQIARASSAMDYLRRKPSPVPRSASAITSPFANGAPTNPQEYNPYSYGYTAEATPRADQSNQLGETQGEPETPSGPQLGSWWGGSSAPTPTATSFAHPEVPASASNEGFISLMDAPALVPTPSLSNGSAVSSSSSRLDTFDEDDDLGLGNSASRAKAKAEAPQEASTKPAAEPEKMQPAKEAEKSASSGGWFSRLWKKEGPTPVKANLGDQNTFYYDKELKRWVNKNAGAEVAAPSPPPPPPRAQTASPATASGRPPPVSSPAVPPPRPATAIDLTDGPPKKPPMRVRSNLVPSDVASAPNTPAPPRTPMANSMDPPGLDAPPTPGSRPRSAAKRPARNRYVDVFQQEAS